MQVYMHSKIQDVSKFKTSYLHECQLTKSSYLYKLIVINRIKNSCVIYYCGSYLTYIIPPYLVKTSLGWKEVTTVLAIYLFNLQREDDVYLTVENTSLAKFFIPPTGNHLSHTMQTYRQTSKCLIFTWLSCEYK